MDRLCNVSLPWQALDSKIKRHNNIVCGRLASHFGNHIFRAKDRVTITWEPGAEGFIFAESDFR